MGNILRQIKAKLVTASSTSLTTANYLGTIRMSFALNYSNIVNGLPVGIPLIRQTGDMNAVITPFVGGISGTTLTLTPYCYGNMLSVIGGTGGISTVTLTTGSASAIPIGSVITGAGISGYVTITAQSSATSYTMSSAQTIPTSTPITAMIPNNVTLPIGALITGNGVTANSTISAQTGAYTYTVNNSQTIGTIPMLANPSSEYLELDTTGTNGQTISTPSSNYLHIQFLKTDETTLMSNIPEYTVMFFFEFDDDKGYGSD